MANKVSECDKYGAASSTSCSHMARVHDNSSCTPVPYIENVCRAHLLEWQDCAIGTSESGIVVISAEIDQTETEQMVVNFLQVSGKCFTKRSQYHVLYWW